MKFIINSNALLKQLQKLNGVISANNTLPILDNFLFDIKQNQNEEWNKLVEEMSPYIESSSIGDVIWAEIASV